jgi:hypothetical protein
MKKIWALIFVMALTSTTVFGQAVSQTGGAIQGSITDPTGAKVPGVSVVISSPDTGYSHTMVTDKSGFYAIGPLNPGTYVITVTAPNFEKLIVKKVVDVGTVTSGSEKLTVGKSSETIEVNAGALQVNTEQIGVAGIVSKDQIDTLPINGRNILDIAQIQPGVVLQSGQGFDPTKTGYSALAINGQNGRSTRILIDGQDISDETVGTTLFNVPSGAIGEFQLNRSTQDVSGSVTSTGQVLLATQSGTNRYHGNMLYNFQDARAGFANVSGIYGPFQRNQYGGYVGGFIVKNKLYFFGGSERIKQFDSSPVSKSSGFLTAIYNMYPQVPDPFKDTFSVGRFDYSGPWGVHYFVRATYSNNTAFGTEGQAPYALYQNQDNVPAIVGGADFTTGKFTHSIRYGYIKFINHIGAGANSLGNTVYNPSTSLGFPFEMIGAIYAGSGNEDAPQSTYQSSKQFRYDGTWTKGSHNIKYGGEVTRILQGGFAAFYSTFLADISTSSTHQLTTGTPAVPTCASATPIGGIAANGSCLDDPLYGYKPAEFVLGNGNGSFSERPAFGLPGGGDFSWRLAAYIGDTWKVTPSLTLVAGLRWSVDTDRANQDLPTITCGQVDVALQFTGCTSANPSVPLFDFYGPGEGLGKPTQQNYANLGPQAGFVFSPGAHKLVLRGGAGIYYENNLFNNGSNARAENSPAQFPGFTYGVTTYTGTSITLPGYNNAIKGLTPAGAPCTTYATPVNPACYSIQQVYGMNFAAATTIISGLDKLYKAASAVPQPNTAFIGSINGAALFANSAYAGPYKTPYSIQMNGGAQYEIKPGLVLSADFIHNATLKIPLSIDTNHNGAARTLNTAAAKAAITATLAGCGAATVAQAVASGGCPGGTGTANGHPYRAASTGDTGNPYDNSASITDFAGNGLDSGGSYLNNVPASAYGLTPATGAAFAGTNANVGTGSFILPVGKSGYDALQIVLQQQKAHPMRGIVSSNLQISYSLSRAVSNSKGGSNQFFAGSGAFNQDCVNCNIGRDDADRSNQVSLGGSLGVKYGLQIGLVGHFFSAPPSTLTLGGVTGGGQLFTTDVDGDGTTGDLLPGTRPGSFMHDIKGVNVANVISRYNATSAGTLTPAGTAVTAAGLFTTAQLVKSGGALQPLIVPTGTTLQNDTTRTLDASFKYPITYLKRFREGLTLTPGVSIYNIANMGNSGGFGTLADTSVNPTTLAAGTYLNGPNTPTVLGRTHISRGTGNGTYDQGGPRTTEFSLKLDF